MVGVTFDANGGYFYDEVWTTSNLSRLTQYYSPGSRILSGAPLCAKAGCSFAGWYTAGGTQLGGTTVATSPITYYARWLQPDLYPHARPGWSAPLVVSASRANATTETASSFTDMDNLYVSWAVVCSGAGVGTRFYNSLYVDGVQKTHGYPANALSPGNHTYDVAYSIGRLSVGTHTIKIVADVDNGIAESNEGNNTYTRTITVTRAPGSCADSAVPFTMPSSVVKYDVTLVREWCSSSYSSSRGSFYATTSLSRGRLYTIAMLKASAFDVTCTDSKAVITYGFDDFLAYYLIDTRGMSAYSAKATLAISGSVGARVPVYVVAADYMPFGNWSKPEVLPASSADGQFRYDVPRSLRNGIYSFSLDAVVGMRYEMRVSGRRGLALNVYSGVVDVLEQSKGDAFHRILFSCPKSGKVTLDVSADETGSMSVMWFGVSGSRKFKLALDGNGGSVPVGWTRAAYGDKVGALPVPEWPGHIFGGWFTARAGGARVTSETAMSVACDLTLYAHWTALAAGSCEDAEIAFVLTDDVRAYNVGLTREWRSDMQSYEEAGVLCCVTTVARGRLYTIAMPIDSDFVVDCEDEGAVVTYGEDSALAYYLIDTRKMFADSAKVHLRIAGDVGARATVYAVAGDYMPLGNWAKPEILPADNGGAGFSYKVSRNLLDGWYSFSLSPVPDMVYELRVSGLDGIGISVEGDVEDDDVIHVLDCSGEEERNSAFVVFTCPSGEPLTLFAGAGTTGPVTVEWSARRNESMMRLKLDGNGGLSPVGWVAVGRGEPVGELPEAVCEGFLFDGWYTKRDGGVRVTKDTAFGDVSDATVYARWIKLALGSCAKAPIPFTIPAGVVAYNVALTKFWDDEAFAYVDDGVLFCTTTLRRGGLYTIAMPLDGPFFEVECEADGASVEYGEDDALRYCLVDTRGMAAESATASLVIRDGDAGEKTTVYAVAADYMPLGSSGKPEILPAKITSDDGYFYYEVRRDLRNGSYEFTLNAVPGVIYELRVSGREGLSISLDSESDDALSVLDSSKSRNSAYALFSSPDGGEISICVDADTSGQVSVEWGGTMECDDCYATAP